MLDLEKDSFRNSTRSRAFRRFMRNRKIAKRIRQRSPIIYPGLFGVQDRTQRGMLGKTATPCSCTMCGNPRKFFRGKRASENTKQELISDISAKEFSFDLGVKVKT